MQFRNEVIRVENKKRVHTLSYAHTHSHTHTHTLIRTHTLSYAHTHSHTHTHTLIRTHIYISGYSLCMVEITDSYLLTGLMILSMLFNGKKNMVVMGKYIP